MKGIKGFQKGHPVFAGAEKTQFKKGHIMSEEVKEKIRKYNLGPGHEKYKDLERNKKISESKIGYRNPMKRVEVRDKISGQNSFMWKGDDIGIAGIHDWLRREFGKANHCDNKNCEKVSDWYDWAKLADLGYERKKENFVQLCRRCHVRYDKSGISILL